MRIALIIFFIIAFYGCKQKKEQVVLGNYESVLELSSSLKVVKEKNGLKVVSGGKEQFFSYKNLPLEKVVCLPSSSISYLDALDVINKVVGIAEPNFIYNQKISTLLNQKKVKQVGTANELFLEDLFMLQPDLVISSSNPLLSKFHKQLELNNIPIIYLDEYKEKTPLAKTELIKLFGILFGKEKKAEQLFNEVSTNYNLLKKLANTSNNSPLVMAGVMYGDIWYAPGASSFPSQFFKDANARYIWENKKSTELLKLSFEEVFEDSKNVDVWLNAADFKNMSNLKSSYANYAWLEPFKKNKIYSYSKRSKPSGANDYFESGIIRPDWVLQDLIVILHPQLLNQRDLLFYQHLE